MRGRDYNRLQSTHQEETPMPRPAGYAKYPLIVAAPVNVALFERLEEWAKFQEVSKAEVLRNLIEQHIPDLRKLSPRATGGENHHER
jgi:hypothetical protein